VVEVIWEWLGGVGVAGVLLGVFGIGWEVLGKKVYQGCPICARWRSADNARRGGLKNSRPDHAFGRLTFDSCGLGAGEGKASSWTKVQRIGG